MAEHNHRARVEEAEENGEEEEEFLSEEEAGEIKAKNDPRRMMLTQEEWEMAYRIKKEFRDPFNGLDMVSDYWCAQLAIAREGILDEHLEKLLDMAKGIETFKREFNIRDTLEEGCRALQELVELVPTLLLYYGFDRIQGTCTCALDVNGVDATNINSTPRNYDAFMVGLYYLHHAFSYDMETLRKGLVSQVDCGNVDWGKKSNFKIVKQVFAVLLSQYPVTIIASHVNTGVIFNLLFGIAKKVLPKKKMHIIRDCCTSDISLSDFFMLPTVEATNARLVSALQESLKIRYQNEKRFSLY